jgi:hypothetical protein
LNVDLNSLIPEIYEFNGPFNFTNTFKDCRELYTNSDVLAKLWNDGKANLIIDSNNKPFSGCTLLNDIIPVSWGGTASDELVTREEPVQQNYDTEISALIADTTRLKDQLLVMQTHLGMN